MKERVLVVEDDTSNAELLSYVLSQNGFDVLKSADGDKVLDLVNKGEVAAVVMDVALSSTRAKGSYVDGVQLTRMIRNTRQGRNLPVILVTAHAMRGEREQLLFESGANDYVSKPIKDLVGFAKLVKKHIQSSGEYEALKLNPKDGTQ